MNENKGYKNPDDYIRTNCLVCDTNIEVWLDDSHICNSCDDEICEMMKSDLQ